MPPNAPMPPIAPAPAPAPANAPKGFAAEFAAWVAGVDGGRVAVWAGAGAAPPGAGPFTRWIT